MSVTVTPTQTDVIIIGAGPVGLFAVFECGMMKLRCHVVDALEHVGGQCRALYPEKPIYDIPAFPVITGEELIQNLEAQIKPFDPVFHLGQQVMELVTGEGGVWRITLSNGTTLQAPIVMIAAGVGAFGPNKPPLADLEVFEAASVHYHVRHKETYRGKRLVIAGGGDSAIDWTLSLAPLAQKISLVHRRPKFRAAPESLDQLMRLVEQGQVELVTPYQLSSLKGVDGHLTHVGVQNFDGEERFIDADYLLPFFGLSMNLGPLTTWGLGFDKNHIAVDPLTMKTNLPGVFAIGDVATYPNKLKLILTGFSEAAQAAKQGRALLYPDEAWHFEYSTTSGVPGVPGQVVQSAA